MRLLLVLFVASAVALCAGGCATRPTIYTAPDASKVAATTKRLSAAIAKSEATRVRVEAKAQEAQESSDKIAAHSVSVINLLRELEPFIPAEQKPKFDELKSAADAQLVEDGKLSVSLAGMRDEVEQLKKDHAAVVVERDRLVVDQAKYQADAKKIADAATKESEGKAKYKNQLTSQRILKWVFRGLGSALILAIVVLFVTGKISIAAIRAYLRTLGA